MVWGSQSVAVKNLPWWGSERSLGGAPMTAVSGASPGGRYPKDGVPLSELAVRDLRFWIYDLVKTRNSKPFIVENPSMLLVRRTETHTPNLNKINLESNLSFGQAALSAIELKEY